MPKIVLIRGVPGSGKTTKAKAEYPSHILCEADQYFERKGDYKFDRSKLKQAHNHCFEKMQCAIAEGHDVVIANTFTRVWEMQKYIDFASKHGLPLEVVEATGQYENAHGVPPDVVQRMRERYEAYSC